MMILSECCRCQLSLCLFFIFLLFPFSFIHQHLRAANPPTSTDIQGQPQTAQFVFLPGDAVEIAVYPDTTSALNNTFSIDGYGNIILPFFGEVKISNMSQQELEQFIKTNYTQYFYIDLTRVKIRPLIRVGLIGGFTRPGFYYVDSRGTLWDLLRMGQGLPMEKGLQKMKWEREGKTIESDLRKFAQSGRALRDFGFKSGDRLTTPSARDRTFLEKTLPFITLAVSAYTLYLTYYTLLYRYNR